MIKDYLKSLEKNKDSLYYSKAIIKTLSHFKAEEIKLFDTLNESSLASYFIIATTLNEVQSKTIADTLTRSLKGFFLLHQEGFQEWILIDFGDIILHLFSQEGRDLYQLESLWSSFKQIPLQNEDYA